MECVGSGENDDVTSEELREIQIDVENNEDQKYSNRLSCPKMHDCGKKDKMISVMI